MEMCFLRAIPGRADCHPHAANSGIPPANNPVSSGSTLGRSSSKSAVITPSKSRFNVDPKVVINKIVREEFQQQASLPSMKRVSGSTAGDSSLLFEVQSQVPQQFQDNFIEDTDSEDDMILIWGPMLLKNTTSQKFGSNPANAKLKSISMGNSYELIQTFAMDKKVDSDKGNGSLKNAVNIAVAEKTVKETCFW
nr:BPK_HP1_G0042850.mRNA.1.CDS.1 [Saccharomyces cerevisiae]